MRFIALPQSGILPGWKLPSGLSKQLILVMKLTAFLLLVALTQISAKGTAQTVTISRQNISLGKVFRDIQRQTGYNFLCTKEQLSHSRKIDINLKGAPLRKVLDYAFKDQPLTYNIFNNTIIVRRKVPSDIKQQEVSLPPPIHISGTVIDSATGKSLVGVTIKVKGQALGTVTDADGKFSLDVPDDAVLVVSYLGYKGINVRVDGKTSFNIRLTPSSTGLNEIVVTALGIKEKTRSLGYAVQKVGGSELQTVKGVDVGTSLTGKVSGLVIKNSTEFDAKPTIKLRGETPLLVIDGVPYENVTLRDIPTDNIKSISVLKGPTAAALYGSRGSDGAIMITTKSGSKNGLSIDINSNTMTRWGFIMLPKVQTSYGHGENGHIATDYVWGPKLDIGDSAMQWNPIDKKSEMLPLVSSGKNNLKNFLQPSFITNNNISVTQTGKNGYFRASINHIYDKGQYPNSHLNIVNYTMSGSMKIGDKFNLESHMGYTLDKSPQTWGTGYGTQGYIYQILMWTGPDYDIRQYKDYWVVPNEKQNWLYTAWYDNPYLIANQKLQGHENNKLHASLTANYKFTKGLNLMFRSGYDYYKNETTVQNPAGINSTRGGSVGNTFSWHFSGKGMYGMDQLWGFSTNNDLILTYDKKFGKFGLNALGGGSVSYHVDREFGAKTLNGLSIPGWYSLANAVPSTTAGVNSIVNNYGTWREQVNSIYGKVTGSWKDLAYMTFTGRNDWSSTQSAAHRSYFYPSVSASLILSEFIPIPRFLDLWKIRGSWTEDKTPADIYDNNVDFSVGSSWGMPSSDYPSTLQGTALLPSATRTWEIGTEAYLFKGRLHLDVAYFRKYYYDQQTEATISDASGFTKTLINTNETYARKGLEVTVDGSVVKHRNFEWHSMINYSFQHRYYVNLDSVYSPDNLWTKRGKRLDGYVSEPYLRDPEGHLINNNGFPQLSDYNSITYNGKKYYTDPDFSFGFINNFKWKNFTFGVSIDGRIGGVMYDYIWNKMFGTGSNPATDTKWRYDEVVNGLTNYVGPGVMVVSGSATYDNYGRIIKDTRKYAPNDVKVSYQAYEQYLNSAGWEHGLKNQSFIKLREISIGYNFPARLLSKTAIKSASVSITGQNVFMWTTFLFSDPDVGSTDMNSPSQRMLGIDFKLSL